MQFQRFRSRCWLLVLPAMLWFSACKKEPEPDPNPKIKISEDTLMLNRWIWEGLNEVYLWEAYMPSVNITQEPDPVILFNKLLYEYDDYSWITDDYQALIDELGGIELATGMEVFPGRLSSESDQVVAPVGYVTPGSPAADSGIKRGDIVMTIDGQTLDVNNYYTLYDQTTATYGFGEWDGIRMQPTGRSVTLTAIELSQNPIVYREVIEYEGFKIGYLFYAIFIEGPNNEWIDSLNVVLEEFRTAGVSDVVIDIRYNPGGGGNVAAYFAACLAPAYAIENNEIYSKLVWNDFLTEYWKSLDLNSDGRADGEFSNQLLEQFPDTDYNLDLSKVYFLTTRYTASASESLIIGLYPYSEVIQVGENTYGKCYGSFTIDDWEEPKRHNWAMQPIVVKFANADGYTDFSDGIPPDYFVQESLLQAEPHGSINDPLLAKALELITGKAPVQTKTLSKPDPFVPLTKPRKPVVERMIRLPGHSQPAPLY